MAYCNNCGAYLPDGQEKCLACGFDEAEEKRKQEAEKNKRAKTEYSGGSAYQFSSEELRKKLEEQRERQREASRKWAEMESERRKARQEKEAESYVNRTDTSTPDYTARQSDDAQGSAQPNRLLAALSYLSFLFLLPMFLCPGDEFAKFHAKQGLLLFIVGVIADVVGAILPIGWVFTLFRLYCIYKGMTNASAGKTEPLPYIGRFMPF